MLTTKIHPKDFWIETTSSGARPSHLQVNKPLVRQLQFDFVIAQLCYTQIREVFENFSNQNREKMMMQLKFDMSLEVVIMNLYKCKYNKHESYS